MVARIRRNFCQYRVYDVDANVLVDLYLLGSDGGPLSSQGLEATSVSIWVPMWDHCGRKD